jgi:hypothetical protein
MINQKSNDSVTESLLLLIKKLMRIHIHIIIATLLLLFIFSKLNAQSFWKPVGIGQGMGTVPYIQCIYNDTIDDLLYIGGTFTKIDNLDTAYQIAYWNGNNWNRLNMGLNNIANDIIRFQNKIYVGGGFQSSDYNLIDSPYLATWDGVQWDSVPGGKLNGSVGNLEIIANELYVMGGFDSIGNMEANGIAKWDGATWSNVYNLPKLSPGGNAIYDVVIYQGNTYVGGNFYDPTTNIRDIAMYNGSSWQAVGTPPGMYGGLNIVHEIEEFNNELYVVGDIRKTDGNVGNFIQKWNGMQWSDVGGGFSFQARALKEHNNELYVGGIFEYAANGLVKASKIAKWDGLQWCGLRDSIIGGISALEVYHDTLVIAGGFSNIGGDTIQNIAKWNGGNYTDTCNVFVGIEDIENFTKNITIYPNPNSGIFTIDIENLNEANLVIYNLSGQIVLQKKLTQNLTSIDLTKFAKGMYFVKVNAANKVIVEKIVYD